MLQLATKRLYTLRGRFRGKSSSFLRGLGYLGLESSGRLAWEDSARLELALTVWLGNILVNSGFRVWCSLMQFLHLFPNCNSCAERSLAMASTMMAKGSFISAQKLRIYLCLLQMFQEISRQLDIYVLNISQSSFLLAILSRLQKNNHKSSRLTKLQHFIIINYIRMPPKKVKDSQPKVVVPEGDPKIGKSVYTQNCSGCHGIDGDGKGAGAPPLGGIMGRLAGSTLFANGKALKNSKIVWSPEHLWLFLDSPGRYVPGIKMGFPGLGNQMEKAHLIAYLKTV